MKFKTQEIIVAVIMFMAFAFVMGVCYEKRYNYTHTEPEVIIQEVIVEAETKEWTVYEQAKLDIFEVCMENDLNFNLVFAICRLETGNFESKAFVEGWNYCGISRKEVPLTYKSKQDGLTALALTMNSYKGKTIDQMQKNYCPSSKTWTSSVKQIIKEEGGNENAYM